MGLIFCDGMDHYDFTHSGLKWNIQAAMQWNSTAGRFSNGSLYTAANNNQTNKITIPDTTTIVFGFAFKISQSFGQQFFIAQLFDSGALQIGITLNASNQLSIAYQAPFSGITTLATSTNAMTPNVWYFVEVKLAISSSVAAGGAVINVNNTQWLSASGINTNNTGSGKVNTFCLGKAGSDGAQANFDDLYICDTTGSHNNDILGDCRIETLYPTSAGANTQFTPNGAANNYACVNQSTPDDDTTFVASNTVGNNDSYIFGAPTGSILGINAIQFVNFARKDNAGTRRIARLVRISGTNYIGSPADLSTSYQFFRDILETNPATSVAWTTSDVAALEAGINLYA